MSTVNSEAPSLYTVDRYTDDENEVITRALEILAQRFARGEKLDRPVASANYIKLLCGDLEHEIFGMISLDSRNRVLAHNQLFRGSIDGASVYPREVVKQALADNAAAVVFYHNHPSGNPNPSAADERITHQLRDALKLIDIRVLDHIVVGGTEHVSLAERGTI